jgi:hypothetical protein
MCHQAVVLYGVAQIHRTTAGSPLDGKRTHPVGIEVDDGAPWSRAGSVFSGNDASPSALTRGEPMDWLGQIGGGILCYEFGHHDPFAVRRGDVPPLACFRQRDEHQLLADTAQRNRSPRALIAYT